MKTLWKKSPPLTLSTPSYIEPMHSNHIHLVASTFTPNVWVRGHPYLSPGEAILHNSPSASGCVDSSTIILPCLEEPLKSHITSDHSRDDPITHSFTLHQQPSPLDIVVHQLVCFLGEHEFNISKSTLWGSDTMYANPSI